MEEAENNLPIGVFDSGVGGLTVLAALQRQLPHESFIYLGDTARLPYGTKSPETVARYAEQSSRFLLQCGIKLLVCACNTASSTALPMLQELLTNIPIIGVINPGARAACAQTQNQHIAVIATEATINGKAYHEAIKKMIPTAQITAKSCGLFVSLAEEGWVDDSIAIAIAERYLTPLFVGNSDARADTLLLGCTHFPVLNKAIRKVIPEDVCIVDSANTTAESVSDILHSKHLLNTQDGLDASTQFLVSDSPERFSHIAKIFLSRDVPLKDVTLVDLHSHGVDMPFRNPSQPSRKPDLE